MTNSSEAWTVPCGAEVNTETPTVPRADRTLLVIPGEGGIVRGFINDVVGADKYARSTRGVVARLGNVVQDYRDGAA